MTQETSPPRVHIGRIEIESNTPVSASAVHNGFLEAWTRGHGDVAWDAVPDDAFERALEVDLSGALTGRELGARVAEAILERARTIRTSRGGR